jgi:hypothetical protein
LALILRAHTRSGQECVVRANLPPDFEWLGAFQYTQLVDGFVQWCAVQC